MTDKMLKFVKIGQQTPPKRDTDVRKKDFNEIYDEFINEKAKEQSSRCSQCGVPFCQVHCPLSNNIPDWLKLTAEGRLKEAYELSQSTNNMPEVCGRICPQDRLCEGNCVIEQSGHGTVTIGSIEKYITDNAWEQGWVKPINISNEKNESIGIIGAGPAGLAAAEELRKSGYKITVYDRYDRAGGLLIYGIPNFKLEKEVVERRTKLLKDGGIEFLENLMWKKFTKKMKSETIQKGILQLKHGNYEYPITLQLIKDGRKNKVLNKKIKSKINITMVHGQKDEVVPVSYSRKVLKIFLNAKKKLVIVKDGDHSLSSQKWLKIIIKELKLII
ncbi:NAD(P)-binding protein [Candidatus Pelagibacter bacterium]|nr:NAD(P)-binding protein [Candidatus Pelagibacter bacterium]